MSIQNSEIESWKDLKTLNSSMIKQFYSFKEKYPEHIIFFQIGEFYEIYCEDAKIASALLNLKLTSRTIEGYTIPMCGVPAHSGDMNGNQLSQQGFYTVLVSQRKENEQVIREVKQIITPGTIMDEEFLSKDDNSYIMSAYELKNELGVVLIDTLSGEVLTRIVNRYGIFDLISRYKPKEVQLYLPQDWEYELFEKVKSIPEVKVFSVPYFYKEMKSVIDEHKAKWFADEFVPYSIIAAHYFLISYLNNVQGQYVTLRPVQHIEERDYLYLHNNAIIGLDLLENSQTKKKNGSLFALLDRCSTAKGTRLLKKWIQEPLLNPKKTEARYEGVTFFLENDTLRNELKEILQNSKDIERTLARFETERFKDYELVYLVETLETYKLFLTRISTASNIAWMKKTALKLLQELNGVLNELSYKISKENIIAEGYNLEFDKIRKNKIEGLNWIENYYEEEKNKTGIKNLKLSENKILGYFFEVTKSNLSAVPSHFIERANITSGKRYVTDKLKELENDYQEALDKYGMVYGKLIKQIVIEIKFHNTFIRSLIDFIALLDILMGFAELAEQYHYKKPTLLEDGTIRITQGKHPLLQAFNYRSVIPNNCGLSSEEIQIVTGPNMGGKSTYLKMVGLLVVMAQIGSFVPAKMSFTPVDRVLLRMGANDHMLNNQSTFMVEMEEVAYIVYHATPNSLILMDELGRGTSTNDGISIAHSVIDYIHQDLKSKTICSTHYHELIELEQEYNKVINLHAEAIETEDGMELTYKIKQGGGMKSFGIQVAKKVGLPDKIINKAEDLINTKYND